MGSEHSHVIPGVAADTDTFACRLRHWSAGVLRVKIIKKGEGSTEPMNTVTKLRETIASNESGFTIMEVMISAAIMLVVALAISSLLVGMTKQQTKNEDHSIQFEKQQSLSYLLRFNPIPP
jgi:hypothetical protein